MKKTLSNSKIITLLLVAILMISAFAIGNFSFNKSALAEQEKLTIANDDFSSNSIDGEVWNSVGGISVSNGALNLAGAKGDKIVAKKLATNDDSIIANMDVLTAKFDVKLTAGSFIFAFGLDTNGNITADSFGVKVEKTSITIIDFNGTSLDYAEETDVINYLKAKNVSKGSTIEIRVNKDQSVKVFENGTELRDLFDNIALTKGINNYAGSCGFFVEKATTNATIDNAVITAVNYHVPVSKSVSTNFADDYKGSPLSPDFVFSADEASKFAVKNGTLVYAGSSDTDYIGSSFEYDAFIVDYKLTSISTDSAEDAWIGLDFGRSAKDAEIGANATLAFNLVGGDVFLANGEGDVDVINTLPTDIFTNLKAETVNTYDVLNVRFIAKDSILSLYVKTAGDIDFVHYADVKNVDVSGYLALVSSGDVHMVIDDLAIINQSPIYDVPTNEAPEKQYDIIDLPHDYNKYREDPETLKDEINHLDKIQSGSASSGCGSNVVGSVVIPSAILMAVAVVAIIVKRAKEEK